MPCWNSVDLQSSVIADMLGQETVNLMLSVRWGGRGFNTHSTHQMETGHLDQASNVTKQSIYLRFVWNVDILAGRQDDTWRLNYLFVDLFKMCYLLIYTISTHASTVSALIYGVSRAIWHFEIGLDLLSEDHFCTFFVTRWDLVQLLTFI